MMLTQESPTVGLYPFSIRILLLSEEKEFLQQASNLLPAAFIKQVSADISSQLLGKYDLFICDIQALDKEGEQLCDAVKSSGIPFILIINVDDEKRVLDEICPTGLLWDYIFSNDLQKLPFILQRYRLIAEEEGKLDEDGMPKDVLYKFRVKRLIDQNLKLMDDLAESNKIIEQHIKDENKFKKLVEEAGEVVYTTDYLGNFTYVNRKAMSLTGFSPEELKGRFYLDLVEPGHRPDVEAFYNKQFAERIVETVKDFPILTKQGKLKWVEQTVKLVLNENWVKGFYCVVRDITERKNFEHKLSEHAALLERSNKELEMFAYIASHDLKEPVRKIRAFISRIESVPEISGLGDKARDYLKRVSDSGRRMEEMIDDLLQYSRITRKTIPFEECDLKKIYHEVLEILELQIAEKKAQVSCSGLETIRGNPAHLRQLFQNLLTNAIKFGDPSRSLVIGVSASRIDGGEVPCVKNSLGKPFLKISFRDNGLGFDNKYAKRVFEIFQRLHNRNQFEGTGIGLAIVKKIAERHNGCVEALSAKGIGSEFIVYLPLDPETTGDQ